jgi:hypothetical protein
MNLTTRFCCDKRLFFFQTENNSGGQFQPSTPLSSTTIHSAIYCGSTLFLRTKMATYPVDIPALAPLASGADDTAAPPISQGDPLDNGHVVAATFQHQNRKKLYAMSPRRATQNDVVASKHRKHLVESANFDGGAAPAWAVIMQQNLENLQQQMTALTASQQNLQQQMTAMQQNLNLQHQESLLTWQQQMQLFRSMSRDIQKSMNRSRRNTEEPIEVLIRVEDGQLPTNQNPEIWFPAKQSDLLYASVPQLSALLVFYGQDATGETAVLLSRLKGFLGVTL